MRKHKLGAYKVLCKIYSKRKIKNKKYSQRAFARDIGVSSGVLSLILNGKRKISKTKAIQISDKLLMNEKLRDEFLTLCDLDAMSLKSSIQKKIEYDNNQWCYRAIISIFRITGSVEGIENITERLGISYILAERIIRDLCELGFLYEDNEKYFYRRDCEIQKNLLVEDVQKGPSRGKFLFETYLEHKNKSYVDEEIFEYVMRFNSCRASEVVEVVKEVKDFLMSSYEYNTLQKKYVLKIRLESS